MRIAVLTGREPHELEFGGKLRARVCHLASMGHQVTVYGPPGKGSPTGDFVSCQRSLRDLLVQLYRCGDGDFLEHELYLVHFEVYSTIFEAIRLLTDRRVIIEYVGFRSPDDGSDEWEKDRDSLARSKLALLGQASHLICANEEVRDTLLEFDPRLAAAAELMPLDVLGLGESHGTAEARAEARHALGFDGRFVLTAVGRTSSRKELRTLVEAVALSSRQVPSIELWIVGDSHRTSDREELELVLGWARALGVLDRVHYRGPVSDAERTQLLHASSAYVLASRDVRAGRGVVEALGTGTIPVLVDTPTTRRLAGDAGLFAEFRASPSWARRITELATRSDRQDSLSEQARTRWAMFSRSAVNPQWERLLAGQRRPTLQPVDVTPVLRGIWEHRVDYRDELPWPIVGGVLSSLRFRLTRHLEKYFARVLQSKIREFELNSANQMEDFRLELQRLEGRLRNR